MKLLNKLFSILIFLLCFIIMYESLYFIYNSKMNNYLNTIRLSDKLNLEVGKSNYFIDNVNSTYKDLTNMNYSYDEIIRFEKDSNINTVISNILKNKISYLKGNKTLTLVYSKKELDNELTKNINNKEIKEYIKNNDFKVNQFESRLNSKLKAINSRVFDFIRILLDFRAFIMLCCLLLISLLILFIKRKYQNIILPVLIFNIINILFSIVMIVLLSIYNYNIVSYFFDSFILNIIKTSVIISVIVICTLLLIIIIFNKKEKVKLKPRIRKVKVNEEDFSFGL